MTIETRPALDGIPDEQRVLALAHWWLWRVLQEIGDVWTDLDGAESDLMRLETRIQPETLHRLAMARNRYFREKNAGKIVDNADRA